MEKLVRCEATDDIEGQNETKNMMKLFSVS